MDETKRRFEAAVRFVQDKTLKTDLPVALDVAEQLRLYGLFKQATVGDVTVQAKAKHAAHERCKGMSAQAAMEGYAAELLTALGRVDAASLSATGRQAYTRILSQLRGDTEAAGAGAEEESSSSSSSSGSDVSSSTVLIEKEEVQRQQREDEKDEEEEDIPSTPLRGTAGVVPSSSASSSSFLSSASSALSTLTTPSSAMSMASPIATTSVGASSSASSASPASHVRPAGRHGQGLPSEAEAERLRKQVKSQQSDLSSQLLRLQAENHQKLLALESQLLRMVNRPASASPAPSSSSAVPTATTPRASHSSSSSAPLSSSLTFPSPAPASSSSSSSLSSSTAAALPRAGAGAAAAGQQQGGGGTAAQLARALEAMEVRYKQKEDEFRAAEAKWAAQLQQMEALQRNLMQKLQIQSSALAPGNGPEALRGASAGKTATADAKSLSASAPSGSGNGGDSSSLQRLARLTAIIGTGAAASYLAYRAFKKWREIRELA